ncbi:uncharacterized protein LOC111322013 [Stylophora pistillata]|nr:uncharacterized protein LOC111322013 [Stylophora pistillata]
MKSLQLQNKVSPILVRRIGEVVKRLDNTQQLSTEAGENVRGDTKLPLDVCPEVYKGTNYGYPLYEKGWIMNNCTNVKPLRSVLSVLFNTVAYPKQDEGHIKTVLKGISDTYQTVQVYLATSSNNVREAVEKYENVDVVWIDKAHVVKGWNTLAGKASTPYVLIARDVFHFTWLTQLERQIRVISQIPHVGVAGGSYRNFSGHWKAGCVQTTMKNYVLKYQEGYFHSKNECMFCDYLQGPFVTKKSLFKLDEKLPNEVVFEDWFSSIVQEGSLVMSCPDAMYFTTDYWSYSKRNDRNVWTPLAKKWQLNRVLLPGGIKHSFSCKDIGFTCRAHSELLPVCCGEAYADALSFFQKFTDAHNISLELNAGSALGGVKGNGLLPWDLDGDILVSAKAIEIFSKEDTIQYFRENGYTLSNYEPLKYNKPDILDGYSKVTFNSFYIEVWGLMGASNAKNLPPELGRQHTTFTKANIHGKWIYTPYSPGLYARNRYGREILKHSQSWIKLGLKHSYVEYDPGSFKPCENPRHHGCLSRFPGDGNIPYFVP